MKIVILMEVAMPAGLTEEDVKARWIRNKITARIAHVVEDGAIGQVTRIDTKQVYPASIEEVHARS